MKRVIWWGIFLAGWATVIGGAGSAHPKIMLTGVAVVLACVILEPDKEDQEES